MPPQHQKMRRKALRLLLRHTDAAVEELRDDDDEMLRGEFCMSKVGWQQGLHNQDSKNYKRWCSTLTRRWRSCEVMTTR